MRLQVAGADALILYLGSAADAATLAQVRAASAAIEQALGSELVDLIPSAASILLVYDPLRCDRLELARRVRGAVQQAAIREQPPGRLLQLPVYYAPESGADLNRVAQRAALSVAQVIALHSAVEYQVYAIGFAPGFAYLGDLDARLALPRRDTPRTRVPRGAVAIAEGQTAVYPADSPGGWHLIGRCPQRMFDPRGNPPVPLAVGDRVRFYPVERAEYLALGGELS